MFLNSRIHVYKTSKLTETCINSPFSFNVDNKLLPVFQFPGPGAYKPNEPVDPAKKQLFPYVFLHLYTFLCTSDNISQYKQNVRKCYVSNKI